MNRNAVIPVCVLLSGLAGCNDRVVSENVKLNAQDGGEMCCLAVEPKVIDLGKIPLNTERPFTAQLRNDGGQIVRVERIVPNCGCADIATGTTQLNPGEVTELKGRFLGHGVPGRMTKQILVETDHGGACVLDLTAQVVRLISWSPETVVLEPDLFSDAAGAKELMISNGSDRVVRLLKEVGSTPTVALELPRSDLPPGDRARLLATVPAVVATAQKTVLRVRTTHDREPLLEIPIEIRPKYPIKVTPERLSLGVISKAELLQRAEVAIVLEGEVLNEYKFTRHESPPYLRLHANSWRAPDVRTFTFTIIDDFGGIDLSGRIILVFQRSHSSAEISVTVPVGGFLLAR